MPLPDRLIDVFFMGGDPPDLVTVGLRLRSAEIDDPGYRRQTVARGGWTKGVGTVTATVKFGPFRSTVHFDEAAVWAGPDLLTTASFGGTREVFGGATFEHDLTLGAF